MRSLLALLVSTLLLSGCAGNAGNEDPARPAQFVDDPDTPEDEGAAEGEYVPPPAAEEKGPAVRVFNETFDLTLTQLKVVNPANNGMYQFNLDNNCVNFGKGTVWLVFNGTAEATWSSTNQFTERLAVDIWDGGGQALMFTNGGAPSPSRLDYGQFRITQASTLGLAFIIQPVGNAAVLELPVKLTISFNYIGEPDTGARVLPCYPTPASREEGHE